jgi:hypothetical protein
MATLMQTLSDLSPYVPYSVMQEGIPWLCGEGQKKTRQEQVILLDQAQHLIW